MHTLTSEHNKQARRCRRSLGTVSRAIASHRTAILPLRPHPQNINNELPRMLTTSGASNFRFRLGRQRAPTLPAPSEMVSPAWRRGRPGVTWASVRPSHLGRREGEARAAVGPMGGARGGGAELLAPAREHGERAAARAF